MHIYVLTASDYESRHTPTIRFRQGSVRHPYLWRWHCYRRGHRDGRDRHGQRFRDG